jgi:hypothetical protein
MGWKQLPGARMPEPNITVMVETFAFQITAAVEAAMADRIQAALAGVFGAPPKRGPGRLPKKQTVAGVAPVAARSAGKKTRPKQFCPVPGCKNVAAPVFGMVCKDHKNVAKSKIKKYRADRKATPAGAAKRAVGKKTRTATPKVARARKLQGQYLGAVGHQLPEPLPAFNQSRMSSEPLDKHVPKGDLSTALARRR